MVRKVRIIGSAFGKGARRAGCQDGPFELRMDKIERSIPHEEIEVKWNKIIYTGDDPDYPDQPAMELVAEHNRKLCERMRFFSTSDMFPLVFGGDHSIAVGTWSGVVAGLDAYDKFGLIWIDAHMDAHDEETSESGFIHGMPLAVLLGEGNEKLTSIGGDARKLSPENVTLVGVRSFEDGERKRLERLGVRIIYMDEVNKIGFKKAMEIALERAKNGTKGFGITIDIDGFDPEFAPAVGTPEKGGIARVDAIDVLKGFFYEDKLKAIEITEFNPHFDVEDKTQKFLEELMHSMFSKKDNK